MGLRQEFLKSYVETLIRIFQGVCITYFESIISNVLSFRLHHISRSNTIEITFYTDQTVTGLGFNLSWSTEEVETCDTLHTGTSGVLELHHMDNGYKLPSNCTHSIIAPGRQFVIFKFAFPGKFLQTNRNVRDLPLLLLPILTNLPICNLFFAILCNLFFVNIVDLFFT